MSFLLLFPLSGYKRWDHRLPSDWSRFSFMLLLPQRNKKTRLSAFTTFFLLKRTEPFLNRFCHTDIFTAGLEHAKHGEFKVMGLVQDFYFCRVKCEAKINLL